MLHKILSWLVILFWTGILLSLVIEGFGLHLKSDASGYMKFDVDPSKVALYLVFGFSGIYAGLRYRSKRYLVPLANLLCIALLGAGVKLILNLVSEEIDAEYLGVFATVTVVFLVPLILHILLLCFWWRNRKRIVPDDEACAAG